MVLAWWLAMSSVAQVPPELQPWVPWATDGVTDLGCPWTGEARTCLWPGALAVDADATGASITLQVRADAQGWLALPGQTGAWPVDVTVSGRPAVVRDVGGRPEVQLPAGSHAVRARMAWPSRPATLAIPSDVARVDLSIDGDAVPFPRIDATGLQLGNVEGAARAGESMELDVMRRIVDGVPVTIETRIAARVSGRAREVDLGQVLLAGTRAVSLDATVAAHLDANGHLVVTARPGDHTIVVVATHDTQLAALSAPTLAAPWPGTETWAFQAVESIRSVNLSGAPGIDPTRTPVPDDWRTLPTWSVQGGGGLSFEELRRGDIEPIDQLTLLRAIWLDLDGHGATVRDTFSGTLGRTWRLDATAPLLVGHVSVGETDQLVTEGPTGQPGVELRQAAVNLSAESRVEGGLSALPAVGWSSDVASLSATVHAGPGWRLFAAMGADSASGTMVDAWTLFDLFFVLVCAAATWKLLGPPWGAVALVALVLGRHESGAPQWIWPVWMATAAIAKSLGHVPAQQATRAIHIALGLALVATGLPYAVGQIETALHPALGAPVGGGHWPGSMNFEATIQDAADGMVMGGMNLSSADAPAEKSEIYQREETKWKKFSDDVDPKAVVQTGPGIPTWSWSSYQLSWRGPVTAEQTLRLWWIGPMGLALLACARVGLALALAVRIARAAWPVVLLAGLLTTPLGAYASIPSNEVLSELRTRVTRAPDCTNNCVDVGRMGLTVASDVLTIELDVHAAVDGAVALPGPARVWSPVRMTMDGAVTTDARLGGDGFTQLRVPAGRHTVVVSGPLPLVDSVVLEVPEPPHATKWSADQWQLDGLRADGTLDRTLTWTRSADTGSRGSSSENLSAWVEVERAISIGVPWRVTTTVRQRGSGRQAATVRVPLLPGEAVTASEIEVEDHAVSVGLDRDHPEVTWSSNLEEAADLTLSPAAGGLWETWTLRCSPIFRCEATGIPPVASLIDGEMVRRWRPWPGETLALNVVRPAAVDGQTVTIGAAELSIQPGHRLATARLTLNIISSQGGRQVIRLPSGAELASVHVAGQPHPLQIREDGTLPLPLRPGPNDFIVAWSEPVTNPWYVTTPDVDLGGPAVNLNITVDPPLDRFIVALGGPPWGPVPLLWTTVAAVCIAAPLLRRLPYNPLPTYAWVLLGLGLTQIPAPLALLPVLWLLAINARKQMADHGPWAHNLVQLAFAGLTVAALVTLYVAIHMGLLLTPDLQVAGNGSHATWFKWTADRTESAMPVAWMLWLPLWTWRVVHLLWALWLSWRLVTWLPDAWRAAATGGWFRLPTPVRPPAPPEPAQP